MQVIYEPMGAYQTNCYILKFDDFEIAIDTGVDSTEWVLENTNNLKAILLTHGHFDHVWDSLKIAEKLNIPIYINSEDLIFFYNEPLPKEFQEQYKNKFTENNKIITFSEKLSDKLDIYETKIENIKIKFYSLGGHTPGSSLIEVENNYFSGDILFKGTIGRTDFELSNPKKMAQSLEKILTYFDYNFPVYAGHGEPTNIKENENIIKYFIEALS
jgi:glyoxylase-like metal-dependent hydrolase (beta-lactamase superfamily II)